MRVAAASSLSIPVMYVFPIFLSLLNIPAYHVNRVGQSPFCLLCKPASGSCVFGSCVFDQLTQIMAKSLAKLQPKGLQGEIYMSFLSLALSFK